MHAREYLMSFLKDPVALHVTRHFVAYRHLRLQQAFQLSHLHSTVQVLRTARNVVELLTLLTILTKPVRHTFGILHKIRLCTASRMVVVTTHVT